MLRKTVCYLIDMALPVYKRVNRREEIDSPVKTVRER